MKSFTGRRLMLAIATMLALTAAAVAVAGPAPSSMALVSATFSTSGPANTTSHTCSAANNDQITVTDATYTGTASSADARLAGPITIRVHSVYDGTANLGSLSGDIRIDSTATPQTHFHASLTAVDVNGNAQGWVSGQAAPGAKISGAFAAPFSTANGFGSGTIGATTGPATNPALVTTGNCKKQHIPPPRSPNKGNEKSRGNNSPPGKQHQHDH